jgi:hypothetical protein
MYIEGLVGKFCWVCVAVCLCAFAKFILCLNVELNDSNVKLGRWVSRNLARFQSKILSDVASGKVLWSLCHSSAGYVSNSWQSSKICFFVLLLSFYYTPGYSIPFFKECGSEVPWSTRGCTCLCIKFWNHLYPQ